MKKLYRFVLLTFFIGSMISACTCKEKPFNEKDPAQPAAVLKLGQVLEQTDASDVPFQLYRLLASDPRNVNLSPLSLRMAFEMIYLGVAGDTQAFFEKTFRFGPSTAEQFRNDRTPAEKAGILIAQSAWFKNEKQILSPFKDHLKNQDATIGKLEENEINNWVSQNTHQKIPRVIEKLNSDARALFVNAIYFKKDWQQKFEERFTTHEYFQSSDKQTESVFMLNALGEFPYFENEIAQWVELKYSAIPFSMLVALPKTRFSLASIDLQLNSDFLKNVVSSLKPTQVKVSLPRFQLNQKQSLRDLLTTAGYGTLFNNGNFSNMTKEKNLKISDVIQASSIAVNEAGTEATTATAALVAKGSAPAGMLAKTFKADQPFLFLIRNTDTGALYWIGKVFDPSVN